MLRTSPIWGRRWSLRPWRCTDLPKQGSQGRQHQSIIIKMAKIKDKDRALKAARERKKITYKGKPIRLSSDFSTETLQARREWHDIFNAMKQKGLQPRILYLARLSFKFEGGIKQFPDKQKLREFTSHKPPLQCILEGLLQMEVFLRLSRCHQGK